MQAYNKPGHHSRNNVVYSSTLQVMAVELMGELVGEQVHREMALSMYISSLVKKGKPGKAHTHVHNVCINNSRAVEVKWDWLKICHLIQCIQL